MEHDPDVRPSEAIGRNMTFLEIWRERFSKKGPRFESHLREVRELAGLTPEDLAEYCQVSVETITLIEDAKYEPSVVLAEHLASRLNTTVESLFIAYPPSASLSSDSEERLWSQLRRITLWYFYSLLAISLIGANILFQLNEEDAGIAVFALWALGAVAFLIGLSRIPGYWRYSRQQMRAALSKRRFWFAVIGAPIFFATFMVITTRSHDSWQRQILSFFFYAIFWGGWMYWLVYRKVKPKK
jgi:putative transcriptional regulator